MINPYNIDQCAAALHVALTMPQANNGRVCVVCATLCRSLTSTAGLDVC